MASLEESLFDEVLDMLVDGAHRAGIDSLCDLLEGRAATFVLEKLLDVVENRLLAPGEIGRLHNTQDRMPFYLDQCFFFAFFVFQTPFLRSLSSRAFLFILPKHL
jgi:hypothetical protein